MALLLLTIQQRRTLRRERVFRDRCNPLEAYSDSELFERCRFDRQGLCYLTKLIENDLDTKLCQKNTDIPAILEVYVTLRYYSCGSFQLVTGDTCGLSQPSVCRSIRRISVALASRVNDFITFPSSDYEIAQAKDGWYDIAQMPGIVGAIDGTHINIIRPVESEFAYVNRKNKHSINVMAICTSNRQFINVLAKYPGSAHDSRIFKESKIGQELAAGQRQAILLGDSGYGLTPYLLTPYDNPTTDAQKKFNVAHKRSRVRVEQAFGVLKRRFACLHNEIRMSPNRTCCVIVACFVLHNIACQRYGIQNFLDENDNDVAFDDFTPISTHTNILAAGKALREHIANTYFS